MVLPLSADSLLFSLLFDAERNDFEGIWKMHLKFSCTDRSLVWGSLFWWNRKCSSMIPKEAFELGGRKDAFLCRVSAVDGSPDGMRLQ